MEKTCTKNYIVEAVCVRGMQVHPKVMTGHANRLPPWPVVERPHPTTLNFLIAPFRAIRTFKLRYKNKMQIFGLLVPSMKRIFFVFSINWGYQFM